MPFDFATLVVLIAVIVAGLAAWATVARRRRSADATEAYLKGFRYILSDEPDAALEELTRAANVDVRTVETYFALGALFRRTGEHERAIRLHQNMLLRPDLDAKLRQQAREELALDYQRAGMMEQAVDAWELLLKDSPGHVEALTHLRQIHEERKDFALAAEAQGRLVEGGGSRAILAHLLAEAALVEEERALARRFSDKAVSVDPTSGHAALASGLLHLKHGEAADAVTDLRRACELDPELAMRAAEALQQVANDTSITFFEERIAKADHPSLRVALARCQRQAGKVEEAIASLRRALELDSRFVEARVELGKALLESTMGQGVRHEFEALLAALGQQAAGFACQVCGHGFPEAQFRCPRCLAWDSIRRGAPGAPAAQPGAATRA